MRNGRVIYGIDFSGAQEARNRIWIAKGVTENQPLLLSECYRARDLPNSGKGVRTLVFLSTVGR